MSSIPGTAPVSAFLSAIDYARTGVERGLQSYADAARQVAGATARGDGAAAAAVVQAVEARLQVAANVKVLQGADRALGALLDVRA